MRRQILRAAERRRVLHIVSSSVAETVRFSAEPLGGGALGGTVEIEAKGFGGQRRESLPLGPETVIEKRAGDTTFSVWVTPAADTRIAFATRHVRSRHLAWVIGGLVVLGLAAGLPAYIYGPETEGAESGTATEGREP